MGTRIEDVARWVGVSPKTVSRVLNDEPNVSDAMRGRVLEGLKALDYWPNRSARSLASHRSFLIALLYDNPSPHYVMEVQKGVLDACDAGHYSMMVRPLQFEAADFLKQVDMLVLQSRPDGLVLTPPICDHAPLIDLLQSRGVPFASISPKIARRVPVPAWTSARPRMRWCGIWCRWGIDASHTFPDRLRMAPAVGACKATVTDCSKPAWRLMRHWRSMVRFRSIPASSERVVCWHCRNLRVPCLPAMTIPLPGCCGRPPNAVWSCRTICPCAVSMTRRCRAMYGRP